MTPIDRFPAKFLPNRRLRLQFLRLDEAAHIFMRQVRASAHGRFGRNDKIIAKRRPKKLFNQPRAGATRGARLGRRPDRPEIARTCLDRRDDVAFAYAVTATDFRIIRQGCNGRHRVQRFAPLIGGAKNERLTHVADIGAILDQPEEPVAIGRIPIEHRPLERIALNHQPLVDAARGITEDDVLALWPACEIARAEQVTARHLELGRYILGHIDIMLPGQRLGDDLRLIIERRHKAE